MSDRVEYYKRLIKKALIIYDNLGPNERSEVDDHMENFEETHDTRPLYVDDAVFCKCESRSDVIAFNDKKYCCDCLCCIKEKE